MKVLIGTFNQEKVLVGEFSVIVKSSRTVVSSSRYSPLSTTVHRDTHLAICGKRAVACGQGPG